jgi:hypothetical protein
LLPVLPSAARAVAGDLAARAVAGDLAARAAAPGLAAAAAAGAGAASPAGAAALAGAAQGAPNGGEGASAADRTRWDRALEAYTRAAAALAAHARHVEQLPPALRDYPACKPLEDRFDDLECARLARLRALIRRPAPDLPALALKIELTVDHQAWELTGAETALAALKADARRLCGGNSYE